MLCGGLFRRGLFQRIPHRLASRCTRSLRKQRLTAAEYPPQKTVDEKILPRAAHSHMPPHNFACSRSTGRRLVLNITTFQNTWHKGPAELHHYYCEITTTKTIKHANFSSKTSFRLRSTHKVGTPNERNFLSWYLRHTHTKTPKHKTHLCFEIQHDTGHHSHVQRTYTTLTRVPCAL